jgi:hypothetical protein
MFGFRKWNTGFSIVFCVDQEVDVVFFVLDTKLKTTAAGPG